MAAREVRVSDRAARDLENIRRRYLDAGLQDNAHNVLKSLDFAIRNLPFTPLGSPLNPETGLRERIVGGYVIAYDVEEIQGIGPRAGNVNVLAIIGGAGDSATP